MTPQAYRIIISPEAAADLQAIYDFISLHSQDNAARMVNRLLKAIDSLDRFPHRTLVQHQRPGLRNPVRKLPVKSYIIYFRVIDEDAVVRILTVRHGARRRPRRF